MKLATPSYHGKTLLVRWNQRARITELKSTTTSVKGLMVAHSYCSNGTVFSPILSMMEDSLLCYSFIQRISIMLSV